MRQTTWGHYLAGPTSCNAVSPLGAVEATVTPSGPLVGNDPRVCGTVEQTGSSGPSVEEIEH